MRGGYTTGSEICQLFFLTERAIAAQADRDAKKYLTLGHKKNVHYLWWRNLDRFLHSHYNYAKGTRLSYKGNHCLLQNKLFAIKITLFSIWTQKIPQLNTTAPKSQNRNSRVISPHKQHQKETFTSKYSPFELYFSCRQTERTATLREIAKATSDPLLYV